MKQSGKKVVAMRITDTQIFRVTFLSLAICTMDVPNSASAQKSPYSGPNDRPAVSIYVTTGDSQWDPRYEPLDSEATIRAMFEHLAMTQGADRIYWRGQRDLTVLNNFEL